MRSAIIIILLLQVSSASATGPDKPMNCHYKQLPFSEFYNHIYNETGKRVYYQENWVNSLRVTLDADSITVLEAVVRAIKGSGLKVSVWNNNLVLLPGEKLLAGLPKFETKSVTTEAEKENSKTLTANERTLTYKMAVNTRIRELFNTDTLPYESKTESNNRAFYGTPSDILVFDQYVELPTLEEYFNELAYLG